MKKNTLVTIGLTGLATLVTHNVFANNRSIPSVIISIENSAPSRGALQTPFWIGAHNGLFDLYDRNVALGDLTTNPNLVPAPAVERLAEDGNTGPLSDQFSLSQPSAPQTTLLGPGGPFAPGEKSSTTLNVDPLNDRYLSYASMVIPSNDAFVANGSPLAHPLFDVSGNFVGKDFVVTGSEILDAGSEVNDEIAGNTAFLNQAGPDIGAEENGLVTLHPGFQGGLSYPNGVLNHPVFGGADFANSATYRVATVTLRYVDLGRNHRFLTKLSPKQEVTAERVDSHANGRAVLVSRNAEKIKVRIFASGLSGPLVAAHLHLAQAGVNGPVVVDLGGGIQRSQVNFTIESGDVSGALAQGDDPVLNLLNEMAAGNIYVNLHTEQFPAGEIRGQLSLQRFSRSVH